MTFGGCARGEQHRRRAVPQVVEPDRRQAEPRDQRVEPLGDAPGRSGVPSSRVNTRPGVRPHARPRHPLGELDLAPCPQHVGRVLVDLDDALGVLRLGGVQLVFDLRLADVDAAGGEVDVSPAQAGQLRPAQAVVGGQVVQRVQPVVLDAVEERAAVLAAPDHDPARNLARLPPPLDAGARSTAAA